MSTSGGSSGGGQLSYVQAYLAADVALTSAANAELVSVDLAAGTWLVNAYVLVVGPNGTTVSADAWIGPTSASVTGAYASASAVLNDTGSTLFWAEMSFSSVLVLTATTTVYLNAFAAGTAEVYALSKQLSIPNSTGITAVKIA